MSVERSQQHGIVSTLFNMQRANLVPRGLAARRTSLPGFNTRSPGCAALAGACAARRAARHPRAAAARGAPPSPPARAAPAARTRSLAANGADGVAAPSTVNDSSSSGSSSSTSTSTSTSPSTSSSSTAAQTLFVREALTASSAIEALGSVVVIGNVPAGASVTAGGDVVVLGRVDGRVAAGAAGAAVASDTAASTAFVAAAQGFGPKADVTVSGVRAAAGAAAAAPSTPSTLMAALEPDGTVAVRPVPGVALPGAASEGEEQPSAAAALGAQLVPAAALALGVALTAAPSAVLGSLVGGGAEGAVGALIEGLVYGYLVLRGAGLLAEGSELLLEVLDPGIIGGVILPLLGALPDTLIVLNAGLKGSAADAAESLAVGIGTLAGSTVLLLSLAWGFSIFLGRCNLSPSTGRAIDGRLTPGLGLSKTGVTTGDDVPRGAAIMAASTLLYATVQVPAFAGGGAGPQAAYIGAAACAASAVAYCVYCVASPELQRRKIAAARRRRLRLYAVKALAERTVAAPALGALVDPAGRVNRATLQRLFAQFDANGSGCIDVREAAGILAGLSIGDAAVAGGGPAADHEALFADMDANEDRRVTFDEFAAAMERWVGEKLSAAARSGSGGSGGAVYDPRFGGPVAALLADLPPEDASGLRATAAEVAAEPADEAADDLAPREGEAGEPAALSTREILLRAGAFLAGGVALCSAFSDPLVESLTNLSRATNIEPFFVGFVLTPLASNSSEFLSSLKFAARKRVSNMSLTLSQVYGAVTINNTVVLGVFLYVVAARGLDWVYSSEVVAIVGSTLIMGAIGASRTTFSTFYGGVACALYPLSLLTVWLLDTRLGWQ